MLTDSPLGAPVQIAYAVVDVREAASSFCVSTGAGPFFVIDHIALARACVHGIDAPFDHSSAYGQWGPLMVELVREHTSPIVEPGRVHHLAFMVQSLEAAATWCVERGWSEVLLAETTGGQQFAFHDARDQLGHLVELYEPSPGLIAFYAMVADAAEGWDGIDPLRTLA